MIIVECSTSAGKRSFHVNPKGSGYLYTPIHVCIYSYQLFLFAYASGGSYHS